MSENPPQGQTVYINYFDEINTAKTKVLMAVFVEVLVKYKPKTVYFCMSSPGGEVAAGLTLYNFLRSLPVKIITHNIGSVDSIGITVFLAGTERYASPSSSFLFHGLASGQLGRLTTNQLREALSSVEHDEHKIAQVITDRTKLTETEVRQMFVQGESKNLAFAESKGVIDSIRDLSIPADTPIISLNIA